MNNRVEFARAVALKYLDFIMCSNENGDYVEVTGNSRDGQLLTVYVYDSGLVTTK